MSIRRRAFTIVELLVTIAIIGILVGMLAPALQSVRETSRRTACQSQLIPIGMAIQTYHDRWMHYPVGTVDDTGPVTSAAVGNHHNWLGRLVDLLDQPVIASRIDRTASVYDPINRPVLELNYPGVKCPSATTLSKNYSSYAGLHHHREKQIDEGDWGVFVLNVTISRDDIPDGLANTAFIAEKMSAPDDLGWLSGTRATLRNVGGGIQTSVDSFSTLPTTVVGSIGSHHPAGAHLLFGSGEIRFLATQTDQRVLEQMADRRDGLLPMQYQTLESQRLQSLQ